MLPLDHRDHRDHGRGERMKEDVRGKVFHSLIFSDCNKMVDGRAWHDRASVCIYRYK